MWMGIPLMALEGFLSVHVALYTLLHSNERNCVYNPTYFVGITIVECWHAAWAQSLLMIPQESLCRIASVASTMESISTLVR